jgi:hypothetical protein
MEDSVRFEHFRKLFDRREALNPEPLVERAGILETGSDREGERRLRKSRRMIMFFPGSRPGKRPAGEDV